MIDRDRSNVTQNGAHEPTGNLGLSVNCFTPGDRQAPISLRWVERSHMGNLGFSQPTKLHGTENVMPPLTTPETEPEVSAAPGEAPPESGPLGLALSGGGVRASLFSLGVVIGLIEAQCYDRVRCIASVSGGSILNAALAHARDLVAFSSVKNFEAVALRLAGRLAWQGVFAFDLRSVFSGLWYVLQVVVRALGVMLPLAILFDPSEMVLFFDQFGNTWGFDLDVVDVPWRLVALIAVISLAVTVLASRGLFQQTKFSQVLGAVDDSITGHLYVRDWGKTSDEKSSGVMHVLVATDLLSGQPMYFSGGFVHCRPYGWSKPEEIRTEEALYSSAAFPVVFPPKRLKLSRLNFQNGEMPGRLPRSVRLVDGGVYNNLGTDWFEVLSEQLRTSRPVLWAFGELSVNPPTIDATNVIVVNASAPSRDVRWLPPFPIARIMSVLYDNTVRPRVQSIQDEKRPLIDIDNSPLEMAHQLKLLGGDAGDRATALAAKLGGMSDQFWAVSKSDAAGTKTKLSRAGRRTAARLMLHGYLLSLVLLHVRFGARFPERLRGEEYFLSLVARPWTSPPAPSAKSEASPSAEAPQTTTSE